MRQKAASNNSFFLLKDIPKVYALNCYLLREPVKRFLFCKSNLNNPHVFTVGNQLFIF